MNAPFRLLVAALAALALPACTPAAEAASKWQSVYPSSKQKSVTVADQGVTVIVTPAPPYDEDADDTHDSFRNSYEDATVDVQFPGLPAFRVPKDEFRSSPYGISVGIGRLNRQDATPTVLLSGYTGGMHCCATLQVVSLVDGQPVVDTLPAMDGEPLGRFPRDIDGDGTIDIRWFDDSLLYQFTSHAGSWQVPRIYAIERGHLVDVSREPRFAPVFRDFARETLDACRKGEAGHNGACAAYAYATAVLGQADQGIRTAVSLAEASDWLPSECTVAYVDDMCPEGKEMTFDGFEQGLRWIMHKNGYLP
ncbi:MAG: hypothetical protein ABIT16_04475 [Croceibacterium sp.]